MQTKSLVVILFVICLTRAELQGPPIDNSAELNNRKSDSTNDDATNSNADSDNKIEDSDDSDDLSDEHTIASLLAEDFSYPGIKIIKAPDLSQEKEARKMTEMLSTLVNSHAELVEKLEHEIKQMDGSIASLANTDEQEPALSQEEIELEQLYESAMKILNKTRSDKADGFILLKQAAEKGHAKSQARIAWHELLGNQVEMNFDSAKQTFLKLADAGLPDAHMVSSIYILQLHKDFVINEKNLNFLKFIIFCRDLVSCMPLESALM